MARYFYDGDPRVFSQESGGHASLSDLQHRHAGHRLLIFGSGEKLIDAITGRATGLVALIL